jgi:hypothetical protein
MAHVIAEINKIIAGREPWLQLLMQCPETVCFAMNGGNCPRFSALWKGFKVLLVGYNSKIHKMNEAKKTED